MPILACDDSSEGAGAIRYKVQLCQLKILRHAPKLLIEKAGLNTNIKLSLTISFIIQIPTKIPLFWGQRSVVNIKIQLGNKKDNVKFLFESCKFSPPDLDVTLGVSIIPKFSKILYKIAPSNSFVFSQSL
jgi:hypothetical protein